MDAVQNHYCLWLLIHTLLLTLNSSEQVQNLAARSGTMVIQSQDAKCERQETFVTYSITQPKNLVTHAKHEQLVAGQGLNNC